jgi:hypothetical protein
LLSLATSGIGSAKKNASTRSKQLQLALEWNRVDIAKYHIMKDDRDWEVRQRQKDAILCALHSCPCRKSSSMALQRNQIEFVKLFLDHDLSLSDVFRNAEKLPSLYQQNLDQVPVVFLALNLTVPWRLFVAVLSRLHARRLPAHGLSRTDSTVGGRLLRSHCCLWPSKSLFWGFFGSSKRANVMFMLRVTPRRSTLPCHIDNGSCRQ